VNEAIAKFDRAWSMAVRPSPRAEAKAIGLKTYFTGKPCKNGHVAERFTGCGSCVECKAARAASWAAANPEKVRDIAAAYRKANPGKRRACFATWYAANSEKVRARAADYRTENAEKVAARMKVYRKSNPEKVRASSTAWKAANREKLREYWRNRRARKRGAEGKCTAKEAAAIREAQKDRCAYCRVKIKGGGHLDHIIPLARGGTNWPSNQQWLCEPCNLSKQAADPIEFARKTGRLV
jgi:5-methylcytosine-specific restriction endonuclease McrA